MGGAVLLLMLLIGKGKANIHHSNTTTYLVCKILAASPQVVFGCIMSGAAAGYGIAIDSSQAKTIVPGSSLPGAWRYHSSRSC